jgi:hypothetical protein
MLSDKKSLLNAYIGYTKAVDNIKKVDNPTNKKIAEFLDKVLKAILYTQKDNLPSIF